MEEEYDKELEIYRRLLSIISPEEIEKRFSFFDSSKTIRLKKSDLSLEQRQYLSECLMAQENTVHESNNLILTYYPQLEKIGRITPDIEHYLRQSADLLKRVGVLHADIFPNNIMMHGPYAVIIDWGEAILDNEDDSLENIDFKRISELRMIQQNEDDEEKRREKKRQRRSSKSEDESSDEEENRKSRTKLSF